MIIPKPQDIGAFEPMESPTHKHRVETIIDRFLLAVRTKRFHYLSKDDFAVIMFPVNEDFSKQEAFDDAVKALNEAGWNVTSRTMSCPNGWFYALTYPR